MAGYMFLWLEMHGFRRASRVLELGMLSYSKFVIGGLSLAFILGLLHVIARALLNAAGVKD
jgi:hypothetical protein